MTTEETKRFLEKMRKFQMKFNTTKEIEKRREKRIKELRERGFNFPEGM